MRYTMLASVSIFALAISATSPASAAGQHCYSIGNLTCPEDTQGQPDPGQGDTMGFKGSPKHQPPGDDDDDTGDDDDDDDDDCPYGGKGNEPSAGPTGERS